MHTSIMNLLPINKLTIRHLWGSVTKMQAREPTNKSIISQRDLKHSDTRRIEQLMAVVLNKRSNAVDGCFTSRPTGLTIKPILFVVLSRLSPLGLRKHALMLNLIVSLRCHGLIRKLPRTAHKLKNASNEALWVSS